jgi:hypothetical protein
MFGKMQIGKMARKYTCHFTEEFVESTPEQLLLRERALDILADYVREYLYQKRAAEEQKMGSMQDEAAPRASRDTSCFVGLPAGLGSPAGSSPPPTA